MKKLIGLLLIITAIIFYPSCKKTDVPVTPQQVDSVKIFGVDSTQLVKNLTIKYIDSTGAYIDSSTVYMYYDTLNRKIIFNPQYVGSPSLTNYSFELTYNSGGLITQQKTNPALLTDTTQVATTDITYDAQNILSTQTNTYYGGSKEIFKLTKTGLPADGYSLSIKTSSTDFVYDSTLNTYTFDANGKFIVNSELLLPALNGGYIDSILYDGAGNVSKVIETNLQSGQPNETYNLFEFSARSNKGNQLSQLNNILFNGISKFPGSSTIDLGSLLNGFENYYFYQFSNYPATGTKVYRLYDNTYLNFDPATQYDSQNRVTKYKMYNGDSPYYYTEYNLEYYK